MKHIHKYIVCSYSGFLNPSVKRTKITERCRCGSEINRNATIIEVAEMKKENREGNDLFVLFDKVCDKIYHKGKFKYTGYELICIFDKLQKKYPKILSCHIDDENYMNSAIFFVPCMNKKEYFTTTVFIVPQSGEPLRIVMSPSDVEGMIPILKKLDGKFGKKLR